MESRDLKRLCAVYLRTVVRKSFNTDLELLAVTEDIGVLDHYLSSLEPGSDFRIPVETQVAKILARESSLDLLMALWHYTNIRSLIQDRVVILLAAESRIDILVNYQEHTVNGDMLEELFNIRIMELLVKQLPEIKSINTLASYCVRLKEGSDPHRAIEARMVEVLKADMVSIGNVANLISLRSKTRLDSKPRELIEARMVEVLEAELPSVSGMKTLVYFWKNSTSGTELGELIKARMVEVLRDCQDITAFTVCRTEFFNIPGLVNLFEARMAELLEKESFSADDINDLLVHCDGTAEDSLLREAIETCIAEILVEELPKITEMIRLIYLWHNIRFNSKPGKLIELRMIKLLKGQLPNMRDMEEMIHFWENTTLGSEPKKLIEVRMLELLREVEVSNIPGWFIEMLLSKKVPAGIEFAFYKKVEYLLELS